MITLTDILFVSSALLAIGLFIILTRKNAIMILIGVELILNACSLNLIAFSKFSPVWVNPEGYVFSLFVIVLAAAESVVGLSIFLSIYRGESTINADEIRGMKW